MRPQDSNADQWQVFLDERLDNRANSPSGLAYCAVQIAEAIDAAELRGAALNPPIIHMYSDDHGVCVGGRWHGWIMWKHPDGQFVSVRKAEPVSPKSPIPALA